GELVLDAEVRARRAVRESRPGQGRAVRLHRGVLQPEATAFDGRLFQPRRVREALRWHPSGAGVSIARVSTETGQAHQHGERIYNRSPETLDSVEHRVP